MSDPIMRIFFPEQGRPITPSDPYAFRPRPTSRFARLKNWLSAFVLVAFLFTAGGCAKPPEREMADARSAMENARSLKAELYAFEGYKKALEAHSKAQQAFEAKRYREAKRFAIRTKEEADASILIARKNIESLREEARRAIDVLDSTLSEVNQVLENRKEEIANELEELNAGFDLVKKYAYLGYLGIQLIWILMVSIMATRLQTLDMKMYLMKPENSLSWPFILKVE